MPTSTVTQQISDNFKDISNWLISNRLKLNSEKSNFIAFSLRGTIQLPPINLGNNFIRQTDHTKFLGLYIDQNLNFKHHTNHIASKIARSIGILYRLSSYLPTNVLISLYNSLILPYLTYSIESWFSAPNYLTKQIETLQKKSIRTIFRLPYNDHTHEHFKNNNILKLTDLHKLNTCSLFYKYINNPNSNTQNIAALFNTNSDQHDYNTRHQNSYITPHYNKTRTQQCYKYTAIKFWNSIPDHVKDSNTAKKFKNQLKKYLIDQY